MKIKTQELTRLVNVAIKSVGNNKIIPITQMIGVELKDNKLTLSGTDSFNTLYITSVIENENNEAFDVCVNADTLNKLVNKFTTEFTEITFKKSYLEIVANGTYQLDLLLDDEGEVYKFMKKTLPSEVVSQELELSKFSDLKFYAEKALATTMEEPAFIAYFTNKDVGVATDRNVMSVLNKPMTEVPLTLRSKFVELANLMKEKITLNTWENSNKETQINATDGEISIYSKVNTPIEDYPYEVILNVVNESQFPIKSKINIKELSNVLERIALMVTQYDSNVISLELSLGKLYVQSVKKTGIEVITLKDIDTEATWKGLIDIELLKSQLPSFIKEEVELYLGNDDCIELKENDVTKLICLVSEE